MMTILSENRYDFLMENNSTLLITGPPKCGKTISVFNLIQRKDRIFKAIGEVYWFYGIKINSMNRLKILRVILEAGSANARRSGIN